MKRPRKGVDYRLLKTNKNKWRWVCQHCTAGDSSYNQTSADITAYKHVERTH